MLFLALWSVLVAASTVFFDAATRDLTWSVALSIVAVTLGFLLGAIVVERTRT